MGEFTSSGWNGPVIGVKFLRQFRTYNAGEKGGVSVEDARDLFAKKYAIPWVERLVVRKDQSGEERLVSAESMGTVYVPTADEVVAAGYPAEMAPSIIARQRALARGANLAQAESAAEAAEQAEGEQGQRALAGKPVEIVNGVEVPTVEQVVSAGYTPEMAEHIAAEQLRKAEEAGKASGPDAGGGEEAAGSSSALPDAEAPQVVPAEPVLNLSTGQITQPQDPPEAPVEPAATVHGKKGKRR